MALDPLIDRLQALQRESAPEGRLGIAFSGGLDSRFLTHSAVAIGLDPILMHCAGPHVAPAESAQARDWAADRGLRMHVLHVNPLSVPEVASNAEDRCYFCKKALFAAMLDALHGAACLSPGQGSASHSGIPLCDGSNLSDRLVYRPGIQACRELGILSPLAEAGLDKSKIHELARRTGLDQPDQRARPCLLTRLPYGMTPTVDLLSKLAEAEARITTALQTMYDQDLPDFRLRIPEENRTELHVTVNLPGELQAVIRSAIQACGLSDPVIMCMKTLSGYYDRGRNLNDSTSERG